MTKISSAGAKQRLIVAHLGKKKLRPPTFKGPNRVDGLHFQGKFSAEMLVERVNAILRAIQKDRINDLAGKSDTVKGNSGGFDIGWIISSFLPKPAWVNTFLHQPLDLT